MSLSWLFFLGSCHKGKSDPDKKIGWNDKVEDTFYGCKMGDPRDYLAVSFADNMFLQIGFRKKFSNKEDALVSYDKIDILTMDKYQFEKAYTDSIVYKHKMAYGRNNVCNSISTFKRQVNDSTITYETSDVYSDRRLKR